ncbi:MAG: hypothetical protein ACLRIS_01395 [Flavonifractor plautii]
MLYRYEDYYDATDGDNLTLTLDSAIQSYCESILKKGIEQFEVQDGGFCIAMDPNTGEILAWANSPTYDLNNPRVVSDPVLNQYLADIESGAYTKEEAYQKALAEGLPARRPATRPFLRQRPKCFTPSGPTRQSPVPMSPAPRSSPSSWPPPWRRAWSPRTATSTAPATSW